MRLTLPRYERLKRLIDIAVAGVGLVVLSPAFGVIAILVRSKLGSPVIFRQLRPGLNGEIFTLYKFRSMLENDSSMPSVEDADRVTLFGQKLRSTSLDELPSLLNVLRGDMSLVGPRPLLVEYLEHYTPEQAMRHLVRPGITGLAQVNGRNAITWEQKFAFDVEYVKHISLILDLRILKQTLFSVVAKDGISQEGHVTMKKFGGSDD